MDFGNRRHQQILINWLERPPCSDIVDVFRDERLTGFTFEIKDESVRLSPLLLEALTEAGLFDKETQK